MVSLIANLYGGGLNVVITEANRATFEGVVPLMKAWMKDNPDTDLVKRAETICCRFE